MADDETPQSSTPEPEGDEAPEASGASTPDEIEAYWRKRISNSDKAHAASEKVLREQLAAAQGRAVEAASPGGGDSKEMTDLVERLQREVAEERAGRAIDTRKAKYPSASAALGDEVLAQVDEARLAALNEQLVQERSPLPVDRNNPGRRMPAGPKALDDMSIDELKAHLKTLPPPGNF